MAFLIPPGIGMDSAGVDHEALGMPPVTVYVGLALGIFAHDPAVFDQIFFGSLKFVSHSGRKL